MSKPNSTITVFEHDVLRVGKNDGQLREEDLKALQSHYGEKGVVYYSLTHQGVKFNEYVGVIQVGPRLIIEVLPKADRAGGKKRWRNRLIDMLRATGTLHVKNAGSSQLQIKPNSILDLYFELLITELEQLLHRGLVKQYRSTIGNRNTLKGSLQFPQHISRNIIHKERFFVRYTTYDCHHLLHQILYEALQLLNKLNIYSPLRHRIGRLLLDWPEQPRLKVHAGLFERLVFNRKTEHYQQAVRIAKMLLLNYHPDVRRGQQDVLALMFDMNRLWERFVYMSLSKYAPLGMQICSQSKKDFWQPERGYKSIIRPDLLITYKGLRTVLDTKWKQPGYNPSAEDLRQLYVYLNYFGADKAALVYPGKRATLKGTYAQRPGVNARPLTGCLLFIETIDNIDMWQKKIGAELGNWVMKDRAR